MTFEGKEDIGMIKKLLVVAALVMAMGAPTAARAGSCSLYPNLCKLPDLVPESLTACSVQPRIINFEPTGYLVTYIAVKVDNRGVASSPAPLVSLTCGGVTQTAYATTSIAAGSTGTAYYQFLGNVTGQICMATVDPSNLIFEMSEKNNTAQIFCLS